VEVEAGRRREMAQVAREGAVAAAVAVAVLRRAEYGEQAAIGQTRRGGMAFHVRPPVVSRPTSPRFAQPRRYATTVAARRHVIACAFMFSASRRATRASRTAAKQMRSAFVAATHAAQECRHAGAMARYSRGENMEAQARSAREARCDER